MAVIEEELVLDILPSSIRLITHAETDKVVINNMNLSLTEAATLAWLINQDPSTVVLRLELKVKP